MDITNTENLIHESIKNVAGLMSIAVTTAPKGRGISNIKSLVIEGEDKLKLTKKMRELSKAWDLAFFSRDADNIDNSNLVFLVGTKIESIGLSNCGLCGHNTCDEKRKFPNVPCAFNTGDLGIAIGSAVSVAADHRIDNRIMFSAGKAAKELNLMGEDIKIIYAIPLSASQKSPFFDRK